MSRNFDKLAINGYYLGSSAVPLKPYIPAANLREWCLNFSERRRFRDYSGLNLYYLVRPSLKKREDYMGMSAFVARQIINGENCWSPEDWKGEINVKIPAGTVPAFPWNEQFLNSPCPLFKGRARKDTHFAMWGADCSEPGGNTLTIINSLEIIRPWAKNLSFPPTPDLWFKNKGFAIKPSCEPRWYLVSKYTPECLMNKTWEEQLGIIQKIGYEPLPAVVIFLTTVFCLEKKTNGRRIMPENHWQRCLDIYNNPRQPCHVCVGYVGNEVRVDVWPDNQKDPTIGIALSCSLP